MTRINRFYKVKGFHGGLDLLISREKSSVVADGVVKVNISTEYSRGCPEAFVHLHILHYEVLGYFAVGIR